MENKNNTVSSYEGKQDHIQGMETPVIETFTNIYELKDYLIEFTIPEFTAICPKTGLPDFGTIEISYKPHKKCIELKSLKEYILFFRNIGIFHENVVNKILEDIVKHSEPLYLKVRGDFHIRGGIKTIVTREYSK
ncbi:MAG: preQ(1) synthase [Leptospiraceae bacterium]|nr:NADPH-dependent 7-cyano-7-deazaguanine reductase QueF [Leptospiraceae bacterium]MCK6381559.1 preQ(1) synthase [Leptospiraceae bacterium]NUM42146.1 NADPH-dependent 7-cyano-7-deazaguanine reductase QueF [Leptospiraceae bacterium]